jgi:hypothetical protein
LGWIAHTCAEFGTPFGTSTAWHSQSNRLSAYDQAVAGRSGLNGWTDDEVRRWVAGIEADPV